nr:hypothetical protein [Desulfovibrio sp.]
MRKFNKKLYINSKLSQLRANDIKDKDGNDYTAQTLQKAIKDAGYSLAEHYQKYADKEGTSAYTELTFDLEYYLSSKLAQLKAHNDKDSNGQDYTRETLLQAIHKVGMTAEQHYQKYSVTEGTSANPYFNTVEYLKAKLQQLQNSADAAERVEWAGKTIEDVAKAFKAAGLSAEEHYLRYGCRETDQDGKFINPSNAFDANAYVAAKLAQLCATDPDHWQGKTALDVMEAIVKAGMTPVSHYERFGASEANASGIAMVQTVPVLDRVANDPLRDATGCNVPSNYNASTPAPKSVSHGVLLNKPADMGGLASTSISPMVVSPEEPVSTPYDVDYVALPLNGITDTHDHPVELVAVTVKDAHGSVIRVAQYGVSATSADGTTTTKAVGLDGKVAANADTIKVTSLDSDGHLVTRISVRDLEGNVLSEKITAGESGSTTILSGKLMDGSDIVSQSSVSSNAAGFASTTTKTTITAKDATKVVIASQSTETASGHITTSTTTNYNENGAVTSRITSKEIVSEAANGTVTTRTESIVWNPSGQITAQSTSVSVTSVGSDGSLSTTTHIQEMDAQGKVTANIEIMDHQGRDANGALHENMVRTIRDYDSGKVITETHSLQEVVASDGSKTTTTNISIVTRTSDGADITTSSEEIQKISSDSHGNKVVETQHTETKSDGSQTITKTTSTTTNDGNTTTKGTVTEKDAHGNTTRTESISKSDASGQASDSDSTSDSTAHSNTTSEESDELGRSDLHLSMSKVGSKLFDSTSMDEQSLDDTVESITLQIDGIGRDARYVTLALGEESTTVLVSVSGTSVQFSVEEGGSDCFELITSSASADKNGTVVCEVKFLRSEDAQEALGDSYFFVVSGKNAALRDLTTSENSLALATVVENQGVEPIDELAVSNLSFTLCKVDSEDVGDNAHLPAIVDGAKSFTFEISGIGQDTGSITLSNGEESFSFNVEHTGTDVRFTNVLGSDKFTLLDTEVAGMKGENVAVKVTYTRSDAESDGQEGDTYDFTLSAKDTKGAAISVNQNDCHIGLSTSMDELGGSALALSLSKIDGKSVSDGMATTNLSDDTDSFVFKISGIGEDTGSITLSNGDEVITFRVEHTGTGVRFTNVSGSDKFTLLDTEVAGMKGENVAVKVKYTRSDAESDGQEGDTYDFTLTAKDTKGAAISVNQNDCHIGLSTSMDELGGSALALSLSKIDGKSVSDGTATTNLSDDTDSFVFKISGIGEDTGSITLSNGDEVITFRVEHTGTVVRFTHVSGSDKFTLLDTEVAGMKGESVAVKVKYQRGDAESDGREGDTYDFTLTAKDTKGAAISVNQNDCHIGLSTSMDELGGSALALSLSEIGGKSVSDGTATTNLSDDTDSFVFNISGIGRDAGSITLRNGEESFSFNVEHTGTGVRFSNVSGS